MEEPTAFVIHTSSQSNQGTDSRIPFTEEDFDSKNK